MYDGIKIDCTLTDVQKWDTSLNFIGKHSEQTGEVLPYISECKYNACNFFKNPTTTGNKYYFQGSLHRYARNGGENNDNFYFYEVKKTIKSLQQQFSINPHYSRVLNFEFGVNLTLPAGINAQDFNKYLISANTKGFEKMTPKRRQNIGYIAEFNEYNIKVYDKGLQGRTGERNKIRFEIKVDRVRWLDQFGFNKGDNLYITDLLRKDNIKILGDILLNKARSLILTPRKVDMSKLSQKQRQTFLECRDARSWEEWDSRTRKRKREQLTRIFNKLNQPDPVDVLVRLIGEKWQELTSFEPFIEIGKKPYKKATFSNLIVVRVREILNYLFKIHEQPKGSQIIYAVYQPRGRPLARPPTRITLKGFNRWIDRNIRAPPKLKC